MDLLKGERETEKRFLVLNFSQNFISSGAQVIEITQHYLIPLASCRRRRVRKAVCGGKVTYTYTEKFPLVSEPGKWEDDYRISEKEYHKFLHGQKDSRRATIEKTRQVEEYQGNVLEWDHYHHPLLAGFSVLEVELSPAAFYQPLPLPEGPALQDITFLKIYSNRFIAKFLRQQELQEQAGRPLLEVYPSLRAVT